MDNKNLTGNQLFEESKDSLVVMAMFGGLSRRILNSLRDGLLGAGVVGVGNFLISSTMPSEVLERVAVPLGLNIEEHEFILRQFVLGTMSEAPWGAFVVVTVASLLIRSVTVGVRAALKKSEANHG